jgi:hypothetical protein
MKPDRASQLADGAGNQLQIIQSWLTHGKLLKAVLFGEIPFQKRKHMILIIYVCLCRNLCTFESTITTEMLIRPKNPGVFNRNH